MATLNLRMMMRIIRMISIIALDNDIAFDNDDHQNLNLRTPSCDLQSFAPARTQAHRHQVRIHINLSELMLDRTAKIYK